MVVYLEARERRCLFLSGLRLMIFLSHSDFLAALLIPFLLVECFLFGVAAILVNSYYGDILVCGDLFCKTGV